MNVEKTGYRSSRRALFMASVTLLFSCWRLSRGSALKRGTRDGNANETRVLAWVVVGLCFMALGLAFSARAALGLVMPVWSAELGWTRSFISGTGAAALIAMAAIVAWVEDLTQPGLADALTTWFGPPTAQRTCFQNHSVRSSWETCPGFEGYASSRSGFGELRSSPDAIASRRLRYHSAAAET
jgi:4-amino-4-deoxy-L-arabinose transferase-like glycosyltransferase